MRSIISALIVIAGLSTCSAEIRYHVTVVKPHDRFQPSSAFLNDLGQMAWVLPGQNSPDKPVVFTPGIGETIISLPFNTRNCYVAGLSNGGAITGYYIDIGPTKSFFWSPQTGPLAMGTPSGLASEQYIATGMNDHNVVVGSASSRAYTWTRQSGFRRLRALHLGYGQALDINNDGEVAGFSVASGAQWRACIWTASGEGIDLGVPPGFAKSYAVGISSQGTAIGTCVETISHQGPQGFIWDPADGMKPIRALPFATHAQPGDINSSDVIVGTSGSRAFIYDRSHGTRQLDMLLDSSSTGWRLTSATSINDSGQIVGRGQSPHGQYVLYLATPVEQ